jgi:hypothetical protein
VPGFLVNILTAWSMHAPFPLCGSPVFCATCANPLRLKAFSLYSGPAFLDPNFSFHALL